MLVGTLHNLSIPKSTIQGTSNCNGRIIPSGLPNGIAALALTLPRCLCLSISPSLLEFPLSLAATAYSRGAGLLARPPLLLILVRAPLLCRSAVSANAISVPLYLI